MDFRRLFYEGLQIPIGLLLDNILDTFRERGIEQYIDFQYLIE